MRSIRQASLGFCVFAVLAVLPVAPMADNTGDRSRDPDVSAVRTDIAGEQVGRAPRERTRIPRGHPEALFALGVVYEYGHGVAVDPYRAAQYYYQAAALYAARGARDKLLICRDALRRLNPDHPYLKALTDLIEARRRPA